MNKIFIEKPDHIRRFLLFGIYSVLISYPLTMFIYKGLRSQYFAALFVMSVIGFLSGAIKVRDFQLSNAEKLVFFSLASITLLAWISYVYFGFQLDAKSRVTKYTWFILSLPLFYLFRYAKPKMEIVWFGVVCGCFVAFGRASLELAGWVNELAWENMKGRANGVMHPIRFGDLSLLMSFIALAGALYLEKLKQWVRVVGFLGFISGGAASLLSQSRGGWLVMPFVLYILVWPKIKGERRYCKLLFSLLVFSIVLNISLVPQLEVGKRIWQIKNDVSQYFVHNNSRTSIGSRFDMYETATKIFLENPLFGVGVGMYHEHAKKYVDMQNGRLSTEVVAWKNPHNEFLLQAATRGVLGLVITLTLFLTLFFYFQNRDGGGREVRRFSSYAGMVVVISFGFFGVTIALFEHRDFLMFFLIYIMLFLADRTPVR